MSIGLAQMVDFWHRWSSFQHFNICELGEISIMPLHFYLVSVIIENKGVRVCILRL